MSEENKKSIEERLEAFKQMPGYQSFFELYNTLYNVTDEDKERLVDEFSWAPFRGDTLENWILDTKFLADEITKNSSNRLNIQMFFMKLYGLFDEIPKYLESISDLKGLPLNTADIEKGIEINSKILHLIQSAMRDITIEEMDLLELLRNQTAHVFINGYRLSTSADQPLNRLRKERLKTEIVDNARRCFSSHENSTEKFALNLATRLTDVLNSLSALVVERKKLSTIVV